MTFCYPKRQHSRGKHTTSRFLVPISVEISQHLKFDFLLPSELMLADLHKQHTAVFENMKDRIAQKMTYLILAEEMQSRKTYRAVPMILR